jgi:hypothetical protein
MLDNPRRISREPAAAPRGRRRSVCLRALAVALFVPLAAHAQPSAARRATATQLFDDAESLMAEGKFADACAKYADSNHIDPQLGTLLHLANCYDKAGKTASAWAAFRDGVEIASKRNDDRETLAKTRLADVERRLPKLTISVPPDAPMAIDVRQDGETVLRAVWGSAVPIDPGKHTISAEAAGFEPWSTTIDVPAEKTTVRLAVPLLEKETVPRAVAAPPPAPARTPATTPAAGSPQRTTAPSASTASTAESDRPTTDATPMRRTAGYVLGGVGIVGLGVGTAFFFQRSSKLGDRDSVCPALVHCNPGAQAQVDTLTADARTATTWSALSFGLGGAALAAGLVLVLGSSHSGPSEAAHVHVHTWADARRGGATIGGQW